MTGYLVLSIEELPSGGISLPWPLWSGCFAECQAVKPGSGQQPFWVGWGTVEAIGIAVVDFVFPSL